MPKSFVVEIWGEPAGIVLQEGLAFRFLSNAVLVRETGCKAEKSPDTFTVEISGEPVGTVRREDNAFRFHAAVGQFVELDGAQLITPDVARLAAAHLQPRHGGTMIRFR